MLHFLTKAKIIFNRVNCNRVLHLIELIELIFENQRQAMANGRVPYLCGGTFLCQVLRAKKFSVTATEHTKGKKDSLSEPETFRRLISVFRLKDFPADTSSGSTMATYTSDYKSCKKSLTAHTMFTDSDQWHKFDSAVMKRDSVALGMMWDFVDEFIDVEGKGEQLVRCLLGIIKNDDDILPHHDFFTQNGKSVTKQELVEMRSFEIEPFLLGVWHYIIMNRAENNELGAVTYQSWYSGRNDYRGDVGIDINGDLTVKSAHQVPSVETKTDERPEPGSAEKQDEPKNDEEPESGPAERQNVQHIEHATIVNQYGENCFHFDHVDVLNL